MSTVTLHSMKIQIPLHLQISSRHNDRSIWETQGGHIEENETPLETAKRELFEEFGVIEYSICTRL